MCLAFCSPRIEVQVTCSLVVFVAHTPMENPSAFVERKVKTGSEHLGRYYMQSRFRFSCGEVYELATAVAAAAAAAVAAYPYQQTHIIISHGEEIAKSQGK